MLLFSFDYPPLNGGISRLCAEIALGFQKRSVPVRVLSSEILSDSAGSFVPPIRERRVTKYRPLREFSAFANLLRFRREPIVCGCWYPEGLLATFASVRPRVVLAHGAEFMPFKSSFFKGIRASMMRWILNSADLVVANSEFTCSLVKKIAHASNAVALPLAVDHNRFSPVPAQLEHGRFAQYSKGDALVLCSVSRLEKFKGHSTVFQALAALPKEQRDCFKYLIAGTGPAEDFLKAEAQGLGVGHLVDWHGYVPEDDLAAFYRCADLFVLCTREIPEERSVEGFGLVFLEAQACGIPVVGTNTGGIPDAIKHGDGGWLIEQDDVTGLSAILSQLLANPERFHKAGIAARARVEREYTWAHYLKRFICALGESGLEIS